MNKLITKIKRVLSKKITFYSYNELCNNIDLRFFKPVFLKRWTK